MKKHLYRWRNGLFLPLLAILFPFLSIAQSTVTVTGKVVDERGNPVGSATVEIKGTSNRIASKPDGTFTITAKPNTRMVISSIGFTSQELSVGSGGERNVVLAQSTSSLDDVVVVGYGTQKKSDVTGAITRITADEIQERPTQNVLQAIQGKAPGVQISTNLKPGEIPVVRIRGNRSIAAENGPLYVIDGIPIINQLGVTSFSIGDLNPNDIASMEILKDASATAIYGSRGANGVVIITTNKGKKGRTTLNYNASVSLDSYKSLTDWMDGGQYVDTWRTGLINGRTYHPLSGNINSDLTKPAINWYPNPKDDSTAFGYTDPYAIASILMGYERNTDGSYKMRATTAEEQALGWPAMIPIYNGANVRSYDWRKDATRMGVTNNHQLSVTAGSENARLSLSLGYFNQTGVQKDQDYTRYNVSLSGDINPTKWFTLGTSLIATFAHQNYGIFGPNTSNTGSKDLYSRANDQFPYALPTDSTGKYILNPGGNLQLFNPLQDIDQVKNERRTVSVLGSIFAELKFTPWLRYRVNFGPQFRYFRSGTWTGPNATSHLTNRPSTAGIATDENFSWVVENLLFVDKNFGNDHKIGVTLLQSSQRSRRESSSESVTGTINPLSYWYDLGSNTVGTPSAYGSSFTENQLSSFMARINYTLFNKYLITATGRADGSSVLAPGHQWAYFPSGAIAWKMQDENFLKNVNWLDELKLRVGYGVTGSSSVNPYTWSGPLSRNPYVFGSSAGIGYLPQLVQNPDLHWERTAQSNVGLDFNFLKGRVSGTVEVYDQKTSGLLLTKQLPAVSGYVQKLENVGKTRNRGIEISLSGIPVKTKDFSWTVDVNWSRNKEEIVELLNGKQDDITNGRFIGQPLNVYYQYQNAGIWGTDAKDLAEIAKFNANGTNFVPGTVRVVDQNGDYKINASDFVVLGSPRPKWTGGITNTFTYKNWTLNSFVYFRWGQTYFGGYPNYGGIYPNGRVETDFWSWNNQSGKWPLPNLASNITNLTTAMQYNNGSFGVVRNISLSYNMPKKWIEKIGVKNLVLNAQILNPFIFGGEVVKWGINPDDDTNWSVASSNGSPLGGTNNNTILPQNWVFGLRAGF